VPLAEKRGVVATQAPDGSHLAIACSLDLSPRPWMLVTDLDTGETEQVYMPEGTPNSAPYASLLSSNGRFYTCEGPTFLEFDLAAREFTFHAMPVRGQSYLSFTEVPGGPIYCGSHPGTNLVRFNPETREIEDLGRLDDEQQYLSHLAVDSSGWVYGGIGTARHNIVAFDPATGERRGLIAEEDRQIGTASVYPGADGKVYGQFKEDRFLLFEGRATPTAKEEMGPRAPINNIYWGTVLSVFWDDRRVRAYNLEEKWLEVEGPGEGETRRIEFDYESEGTYLRVLAGGLDGVIYGCSAHPSFAFTFHPGTQQFDVKPGRQAWKSIAFQGRYVMGNHYGGGKLWLYDTTRPWTGPGSEESDNPRLVVQYAPDINVPVGALAHPDGVHLLMSGRPGYGYLGGGIGIYNIETGESLLLRHEELIPHHSIQAMAALPDGDVICGTTIAGGHGTRATGTEGVLFILDWQTKTVTYQTVPVSGSPSIAALHADEDGLVYGVATASTFFVCDPEKQEVVQSQALEDCGSPVFGGGLLMPDGQGNLYTVLSQGIMRITMDGFTIERLATPPTSATGGMALVDGRVYFSIGSHLWSYGL